MLGLLTVHGEVTMDTRMMIYLPLTSSIISYTHTHTLILFVPIQLYSYLIVIFAFCVVVTKCKTVIHHNSYNNVFMLLY